MRKLRYANLLKDMSTPFINDEWNPWTEKSTEVSFKSTELAVGDGEQKLGEEYDEKPKGQNTSYDLHVLGERWEVKKLDSDNSFRLGVEVASSYRQIIDKVTSVLVKILEVGDSLGDSENSELINECINQLNTTSGSTTTLLIDGLKKNEVSASNLAKANDIIETIKSLMLTDDENKKILLYSSVNGASNEYDLLTAYKKLELEVITLENKLKVLDCDVNLYNKLLLTSVLGKDVSIFSDHSLKEKLNNLVRNIFSDVKLVLVHERNGYKPITDLKKIYCNRITSGNPRCKVV